MKSIIDSILLFTTMILLPIIMGVMGLLLWKIPYADTSTWYGYIMALSIVEITFFGLLALKVLVVVFRFIVTER